jgi:hypothetical protein
MDSGPGSHPGSRSHSNGMSFFPRARTGTGMTASGFDDVPLKVSVTRHATITRDEDMARKMDITMDMDLGNWSEEVHPSTKSTDGHAAM